MCGIGLIHEPVVMHMFGVDAKVYSRSMHVMWEVVGGELLRLMPFGKVELDYDIMPFWQS